MVWILIAAIGCCYGWGMRGKIIGHGKGAMLPGAILGTCVAFLSGSALVAENWIICAALGAAGMFFGGGMTYGDTHHLASQRANRRDLRRGLIGFAWKGVLWFGVAGGFLAFGVQALFGSDVYPLWVRITLPLLPIVLFPLGTQLFNRPHDREKGIRPKIYFSINAPECWGGYLLILVSILAFAAAFGDTLTLLTVAFGALGGGIGWVLAIESDYHTSHPMKSGKYLLGKAAEKRYIDTWKIMEFVLGACGALGVTFGFWLGLGDFVPRTALGGCLLSRTAELIIIGLWIIGVIFDAWLEHTEYIEDWGDTIEQILYACLPLTLILLGSVTSAEIQACVLLLWVVVEKCCFNLNVDLAGNRLGSAVSLLAVIALLAGVLAGWTAPLWLGVVLYTAVYILFTAFCDFHPAIWKKAKVKTILGAYGSCVAVMIFFICSAGLFCLLTALNV